MDLFSEQLTVSRTLQFGTETGKQKRQVCLIEKHDPCLKDVKLCDRETRLPAREPRARAPEQ